MNVYIIFYSFSTNEKWFGRRKMLTPAFHFNVLKGYQDIFVKQAQASPKFFNSVDFPLQVMIDQVEAHSDTGKEVDLFPYVKRCALDIICGTQHATLSITSLFPNLDTAMSTQLNAQIGKNSEYVQAVIRLSDMLFNYERWLKYWFHLKRADR